MGKKIYGIDTLYYFVQSNYKCEDVFLDLLKQAQKRKSYLESIDYRDRIYKLKMNI